MKKILLLALFVSGTAFADEGKNSEEGTEQSIASQEALLPLHCFMPVFYDNTPKSVIVATCKRLPKECQVKYYNNCRF